MGFIQGKEVLDWPFLSKERLVAEKKLKRKNWAQGPIDALNFESIYDDPYRVQGRIPNVAKLRLKAHCSKA